MCVVMQLGLYETHRFHSDCHRRDTSVKAIGHYQILSFQIYLYKFYISFISFIVFVIYIDSKKPETKQTQKLKRAKLIGEVR